MVRFVILLQMAALAMLLAGLGLVSMSAALSSARQLVYGFILLHFLRFLMRLGRRKRKKRADRAHQRRRL